MEMEDFTNRTISLSVYSTYHDYATIHTTMSICVSTLVNPNYVKFISPKYVQRRNGFSPFSGDAQE